jgi:hypothetical protein
LVEGSSITKSWIKVRHLGDVRPSHRCPDWRI